jgi:hypothetical protein
VLTTEQDGPRHLLGLPPFTCFPCLLLHQSPCCLCLTQSAGPCCDTYFTPLPFISPGLQPTPSSAPLHTQTSQTRRSSRTTRRRQRAPSSTRTRSCLSRRSRSAIQRPSMLPCVLAHYTPEFGGVRPPPCSRSPSHSCSPPDIVHCDGNSCHFRRLTQQF